MRTKSSIFVIKTVIIVISLLFFNGVVLGQVDPPSDLNSRLLEISQEERQVLDTLFKMLQELELLKKEEAELSERVEKLRLDVSIIEENIAREETSYNRNKEGMRNVLKSYQRLGPASYLEILLSSESISELIHRINILQDIAHETGKLLNQLEISQRRLSKDKAVLKEGLTLLENKQKDAKAAMESRLELLKQQESYMSSLKEKREYYQAQLVLLQKSIEEVKLAIEGAAGSFSTILESSSLPPDAIKLTFSFLSIKGVIDQKIFNEIVSAQPELKGIEFTFYKDKVEMSIPDKGIIIYGTFIAADDYLVKFNAEEGSFLGMKLKKEFVAELFGGKELSLDLKPILGNNTLKEVKINEGYIELNIRLSLF